MFFLASCESLLHDPSGSNPLVMQTVPCCSAQWPSVRAVVGSDVMTMMIGAGRFMVARELT